MKKKLQELTEYKLMSVVDAMSALGFTWEEDVMTIITNIRCSCGELADLGGLVGCESIRCAKCDKTVLDVTSPIHTSNSTVGILDLDDYEVEDELVYWIAIDGKGGIKV